MGVTKLTETSKYIPGIIMILFRVNAASSVNESDITFVNVPMTWSAAVSHCLSMQTRLANSEDILQERQFPTIEVWSGTYLEYSPWIEIKGCIETTDFQTTRTDLAACTSTCLREGQNKPGFMFAHNIQTKKCFCGVTHFTRTSPIVCTTTMTMTSTAVWLYMISSMSYSVGKCHFSVPYSDISTDFSSVISTWKENTKFCQKENITSSSEGGIEIAAFKIPAVRTRVGLASVADINNNACFVVSCPNKRCFDYQHNCDDDSVAGFFCIKDESLFTTKEDYTTEIDITTSQTTTMYPSSTSIAETTELSTRSPVEQTTLSTAVLKFTTEENIKTQTSSATNGETTELTKMVPYGEITNSGGQTADISRVVTKPLAAVQSPTLYTEELDSTTDHNFLSSITYNSEITRAEYPSLSEPFSTNDQTVIGQSSSVSEMIQFSNKENFESTNSQLTTTECRQEISSQGTSTISSKETSGDRSTSGYHVITTFDSSSILSTTKTTGTSTEPDSRYKSDVKVIIGTNSGVAILILLIYFVAVIKRRRTKDDTVFQNKMHKIDGNVHNNDNAIDVDDKGYTMLQELQNDNLERTNGYSSLYTCSSQPVKQNDGIYDHIQ